MGRAINPRRCVQALGIVSMAIGLAALSGWIFHIPLLTSYGADLKPMAPSSGVLFVLLGAILFLHQYKTQSRAFRFECMAVIFFITAATLLIFLFSLRGIHFPIEHFGLLLDVTLGEIPVGYMSPLTAVCFALLGVSMSFILSSSNKRQWRIGAAFLSSCLVLCIAFLLLVAYIYGAPFMYEGESNPPSLPSSLAFLVLGVGILVLSREKIPEDNRIEKNSVPYTFLFIFIALTLGIMSSGWYYFKQDQKHLRTEIENQLSAVADLKTRQISDWYADELHDAAMLARNSILIERIERWQKSQNARDKSALFDVLSSIKEEHGYEEIFSISKGGKVLFSTGTTDTSVPVLVPVVQQALETLSTLSSDLYRCSIHGKIHIDFVSPLLDEKKTAFAVLVFRMDAGEILYPLIESWLTSSKTSETYIARKEIDGIRVLSALRYKQDAAMNHIYSLDDTTTAIVRAVKGYRGVLDAKDYRGVNVLAYVSPVARTPWFMVVKVDKEEMFAPLRRRLWEIVATVGVLILAAGLGVGMIWRHQRAGFYKERLQAEERIRELNRIYAVLSNINQAIVRVREPQMLFDEVCRIAVEDGGFFMAWIGLLDSNSNQLKVVASAGVVGDYLKKIDIRLNDPVRGEGPIGRALKSGAHVVCADIEHDPSMTPWREDALRLGYRASASFPLLVSGKIRGVFSLFAEKLDFFDEEEIRLLDEMAMDVSYAMEFGEIEAERKRAEEEIRKSEIQFKTLFMSMSDGFYLSEIIYDDNGDPCDYRFLEVNPKFEQIIELNRDQIIGKRYKELVPVDTTQWLDNYCHVARTGAPLSYEFYSNEYHMYFETYAYQPAKGQVSVFVRDISERKRVEEALLKSEVKYKQMFMSNPVPMWVFDKDSLAFLDVNDFAVANYGYSKEEFLSMTIRDIRPPEDIPYLYEVLKEINGKLRKAGVVRHRLKDGSLIDVEITGHEIEFEGRGALLVLALDITDRKRAEDALRDSKHMLQIVLDAIPTAVFWKNCDLLYLGGNRNWLEAAGLKSSEEVVGKSDYDLPWEKEQADAFREYDKKIMESGVPEYNIIEDYRRADGSLGWVRTNKILLRDADGNITGILGTYEDITERKRAEEALTKEQSFMNALMDNVPDHIYFKDTNSRFVRINKAQAEIFGYSDPTQAVGKTDFDIFTEDHARSAFEDEQEIMKTGKPLVDIEEKETWPDGRTTWVSTAKVPLRDEQGRIIGTFGISRDITERKRTEEALRESEDKFRHIFDHSVSGKSITLPSGEIHVNKAFAEMLGYSQEEIQSFKWQEITHPDDIEFTQKAMDSILSGDQDSARFIKRYIHKNGSVVWADVGSSIRRDDTGKSLYFMTTIMDITERKLAEASLKESEERFRKIFEESPIGMAISNVSFKFERANSSFSAMLGYTQNEIQSLTFQKITHPDHLTQDIENVKKMASGEISIYRTEKRYLTKNGDILWGHLTLSKIIDEEGKLVHYFVMLQNITERKLAEETLRESENKIKSIFRSAPTGIGVIVNRVFVEVNDRVCEMTGRTREELIDASARLVYPTDEDFEFVGREKYQQIAEKGIGTVETRWIKKNGEIMDVLLSSSPIDPNDLSHGVTFTVLDITERKLADEQIRKDLLEKEVLLKEIHHRVKNNLTVISSLLNLQAKQIKSKKQALEAFKESRDRVFAMALVHEKLYQSRNFASIDIKSYLDDMAKQLIRMYHVSQNIRLKLDVKEASVDINRAIPCGLILNELITNALKHAFPDDRKGEITVVFRPFEEMSYELIVSDDGVGIPDDFDVEHSESLGLHLVNLLTSQLSGAWTLNREKGTSFRIQFPRVEG